MGKNIFDDTQIDDIELDDMQILPKRHTIHFSKFAWQAILDDVDTFAPDLSNKLSSFLNIIIKNYNEHATCNLPAQLNAKFKEFNDAKEDFDSKHARCKDFKDFNESFLQFKESYLKIEYTKKLNSAFEETVKKLPQAEEKYKLLLESPNGKKTSDSETVFEILEDLWKKACENEFYKTKRTHIEQKNAKSFNSFVVQYLRVLFEEYARLPIYKREEIHCAKQKNTIELAKDKHCCVKISLFTNNKNEPIKKYTITPYEIQLDKMQNYYYVVCWLKTDQPILDESGKPQMGKEHSFRLSRIRSATISHTEAGGTLTKEQNKKIKAAILAKEVQYLSDDKNKIEPITVRFTEAGYKDLKKHIFQRPYFDRTKVVKNGKFYDIEFNCTKMQMNNYLFKFDSRAYILLPSKLHDDFQKRYAGAYNAYLRYEDKAQEVVVQFDEKGLELLENLRCMRPNVPRSFKARNVLSELKALKEQGEIEEISYTHTFQCSEQQAMDYFFSFGKHAHIVSPISLREAFKTRYLEALNSYND